MPRVLSLRNVALAAVLAPALAVAAANHIPHWSMATDADTEEAIKTFGFRTEGKATTFPKKIAIPYFVIRYDKTTGGGDGSFMTVRFSDAEYIALTDGLYDKLVKRFTDYGFEVVPKERVVAARSYAALSGDTGNDEGSGRVRAVPSGMKFLGLLGALGDDGGKPTHPNDLAALNGELGTDAVVAVFANFGVCSIDYTVDTMMAGTKPCMQGNLTLPGLSMLFLGGMEGEGNAVHPVWTSRAFKAFTEFTYQKDFNGEMAEIGDAALISPLDAVSWNPSGFWGDQTGDPEAGAYGQGIGTQFDVAFTLAMETFYAKNGDALAASGLHRPTRAPEPAGARVSTIAEDQAHLAIAAAELEAYTTDLTTRPEGAPTAGGTVSCYHLDAQGMDPEALLKRGVESAQVVEETLSLVPTIGAVSQVYSYTIGAGNTYEGVDAKGTWTSHGTFEGTADTWTSWKQDIVYTGGYSADVIGTTEAGGIHLLTHFKGADGAVLRTFDQHFKALEPGTCATTWATALAYTGAAPAAAPAPGAKPRKGK